MNAAPGCTTSGSTQRICSRCGALETTTQAALGHLWSAWIVSTTPTCTLPGINERVCSRCSAKQTQVVAAMLHNWGPYVTVTAPTCNAKGWEERTCSRCSLKQGRDLHHLAHIFGPWTIVTPAACNVKGQEKRVCTLCAKEETRAIKALKHISDNTWVIVKTATLASRGTQATYCTVCGQPAQTRSYAPRGYRYDAAFRAFGPLAGSVNAALSGLPDQLIYVDMASDGVRRFPLVIEDDYMIGEAVLTIAGGTLRVSLKQFSEPMRLRDLRWLVFPMVEDISNNAFTGFSQPFDRALPIPTASCIVTISGIANYYQGNENKVFSPLMAASDGLGSYADLELMMLNAMTEK